jgi:hypothetical protein
MDQFKELKKKKRASLKLNVKNDKKVKSNLTSLTPYTPHLGPVKLSTGTRGYRNRRSSLLTPHPVMMGKFFPDPKNPTDTV